MHFSFATLFHYLNFVRFCLYSKLELSRACNLRYLFSSSRNRHANIGDHLKKPLILSRESVNMLKRGVVAAVHVVRNHSNSTSIVLFLYLQHFDFILFSHLYASIVATEQRSHNLTVLGPYKFWTTSNFQNAMKNTQIVPLHCIFVWWKPFCCIYKSLWETGR